MPIRDKMIKSVDYDSLHLFVSNQKLITLHGDKLKQLYRPRELSHV